MKKAGHKINYKSIQLHEDRKILRLSDAFITESEGCEWTVTMLNINKGHNPELMGKCEILREYSEFVAMVRENLKVQNAEDAVEQAVTAFIERGGLLSGFLKSHRAEVVNVCITEYREELHLKTVRAEGEEKGRAEGEIKGRLETLFSLVADGDITLERAAVKAGIELPEFRKMYEETGNDALQKDSRKITEGETV